MSGLSKIGLFFGEGDFDFALNIGELEQLQEIAARRCALLGFPMAEASLSSLADRLRAGRAFTTEVRDVLRLALVGGGMAKQDAHLLVARHLVPGALHECGLIASIPVGRALYGDPDEAEGDDQSDEDKGDDQAPGEPEGEAGSISSSPMDATDGAGSSGSAPPSAGRRPKRGRQVSPT